MLSRLVEVNLNDLLGKFGIKKEQIYLEWKTDYNNQYDQEVYYDILGLVDSLNNEEYFKIWKETLDTALLMLYSLAVIKDTDPDMSCFAYVEVYSKYLDKEAKLINVTILSRRT